MLFPAISLQYPSLPSIPSISLPVEYREKVTVLAKTAFASTSLIYLANRHPILALSGYLLGVVDQEKTAYYVGKITEVWEKNKIVCCLSLGSLLWVSAPSTLASLSFFAWAKLSTLDAPKEYDALVTKVGETALAVLKGTALLGLLYINPKISFMGFLLGVIETKKLEEYIGRISHVWRINSRITNATLGIFLYLSLPMTLASGSFFSWAKAGIVVATPTDADEAQ